LPPLLQSDDALAPLFPQLLLAAGYRRSTSSVEINSLRDAEIEIRDRLSCVKREIGFAPISD
jgi:hypothetical protein